MSYFVDSEIVYINSAARITGTSDSNFQYSFVLDTTKNYDYVVMLDCSIPKSFYNVAINNNTFTLVENSTPTIITLTAGNYSQKSLATALVAALNTSSPNGWVYACTFNTGNTTVNTGKYTFTVSGNSTQPSFIFALTLNEVIGFPPNSTNTFSAGTLVAPYVCNLSTENTIFIKSDICQNTNDTILQNIIVASDPSFTYIDWNNLLPAEYAKRFHYGHDNIFQFRITDEFDVELNTNGLNIVFSLMFFKRRVF